MLLALLYISSLPILTAVLFADSQSLHLIVQVTCPSKMVRLLEEEPKKQKIGGHHVVSAHEEQSPLVPTIRTSTTITIARAQPRPEPPIPTASTAGIAATVVHHQNRPVRRKQNARKNNRYKHRHHNGPVHRNQKTRPMRATNSNVIFENDALVGSILSLHR
jgi:hypothetical protein